MSHEITPKQEAEKKIEMTTAYNDNKKGINSHDFFKVHNHDTGKYLVQETFMKTWKYIVKGGKIEVMKAFLYHILNNLIIDEYRKNKPKSLDSLMEKGFEPKTVNESEKLFNIFDGKIAILLLHRLPSKYQKVLHMRFEQSLSIMEIALLTGQTKNTIAVQIHRGL
jgi:RNA polymerase sigma-70 factor (ECF subfamily)